MNPEGMGMAIEVDPEDLYVLCYAAYMYSRKNRDDQLRERIRRVLRETKEHYRVRHAGYHLFQLLEEQE